MSASSARVSGVSGCTSPGCGLRASPSRRAKKHIFLSGPSYTRRSSWSAVATYGCMYGSTPMLSGKCSMTASTCGPASSAPRPAPTTRLTMAMAASFRLTYSAPLNDNSPRPSANSAMYGCAATYDASDGSYGLTSSKAIARLERGRTNVFARSRANSALVTGPSGKKRDGASGVRIPWDTTASIDDCAHGTIPMSENAGGCVRISGRNRMSATHAGGSMTQMLANERKVMCSGLQPGRVCSPYANSLDADGTLAMRPSASGLMTWTTALHANEGAVGDVTTIRVSATLIGLTSPKGPNRTEVAPVKHDPSTVTVTGW